MSAHPWVCRRCEKPVPPRRGRIPNIVLCDEHSGTHTGKTKAKAKTKRGRRSTPAPVASRYAAIIAQLEAERNELDAVIAVLRKRERAA